MESRSEKQLVVLLAALLPQEAWVPLSAGEGSQVPRLYEWAWLQLPYEREDSEGWDSWLLSRRSLSEPTELAYYRAWGLPRLCSRRWCAPQTHAGQSKRALWWYQKSGSSALFVLSSRISMASLL